MDFVVLFRGQYQEVSSAVVECHSVQMVYVHVWRTIHDLSVHKNCLTAIFGSYLAYSVPFRLGLTGMPMVLAERFVIFRADDCE